LKAFEILQLMKVRIETVLIERYKVDWAEKNQLKIQGNNFLSHFYGDLKNFESNFFHSLQST